MCTCIFIVVTQDAQPHFWLYFRIKAQEPRAKERDKKRDKNQSTIHEMSTDWIYVQSSHSHNVHKINETKSKYNAVIECAVCTIGNLSLV